LRARATVARAAPPDCRRVELHFIPNPTSLAQIRQTTQQRLGWTPGTEPTIGRDLVGAPAG
jgi:hypothetical protein